MSIDLEPVAWLRDAHEGEGDECLVPAALGDPGAFPVYAAPSDTTPQGAEPREDGWIAEKVLANVEYDLNGGCWLWSGGVNKAGYGRLCRNGNVYLAHRESFRVFVEDPGSLIICHRCDTPACVNPAHLFSGTNADNGADMSRKGRATKNANRKGETAGFSKLTEPQVREIRARRNEPKKALAAEFGVSLGAVEKVIYGGSWNHV